MSAVCVGALTFYDVISVDGEMEIMRLYCNLACDRSKMIYEVRGLIS